MTFDQQLTDLAHARERTAALTKQLGNHELAGRQLKATLIVQGRAAGNTKTDAETDAKLASVYLEHEREAIDLAYARDITHAQAERLRLTILAAITEAADQQFVADGEDVAS